MENSRVFWLRWHRFQLPDLHSFFWRRRRPFSGDNMSSFNFLDDEVSEAICELVHQKNGWFSWHLENQLMMVHGKLDDQLIHILHIIYINIYHCHLCVCTVNITSIVELVLFFSKWLGARVHWRWRGTCWEGTLKWEFRVTTLYDHIIQLTTGIYNFTYVYMNGAYETKTVHICKIPKRMWLFLPSNGSMKTSMCPMDFGTTLAPQFSSFQVERANKDLAQLDRQCLTQQGCNWLTNFCYTCEKKHVKRETPHKNWWFGWMFPRFQIFEVVFSDSHGSFWGCGTSWDTPGDFPKGKEATSTMECGTYQEYFWGGKRGWGGRSFFGLKGGNGVDFFFLRPEGRVQTLVAGSLNCEHLLN